MSGPVPVELPGDAAVLDDVAWHALGGAHASLAETVGRARRYRPDVTPFAAIEDLDDERAWRDLAALTGDGVAVLFRDAVPSVPDGWTELFRAAADQMVAPAPIPVAALPVRSLGVDDAEAMLALVRDTRPGPFLARTVELGGYVGVVDDDGRLVAMAGERMRAPGFAEISAVCTRPEARGRGLAAGLTSVVAARIRARGEVPFLHVAEDNHTARRVYERLGFVVRRRVAFVAVRPPGAPVAPAG